MIRYYAGIGSRATPEAVLQQMTGIARRLAQDNWVLRSGAAYGADSAFEAGAGERAQIFIPWDGFNGRHACGYRVTPGESLQLGVFAGADTSALELASQYHPNWSACGRGARALHARNGYQVLGPMLNDPVAVVVCWTPGGSGKGGTGQALRIAHDRGIPVLDLGSPVEQQSPQLRSLMGL